MDVRVITAAGVQVRPVQDLAALLQRDDALVWVDIPDWDTTAERVLTGVFGFHPFAVRDCAHRNHVPKVHVYGDHVFVVLHAPQAGSAGHVHYIEVGNDRSRTWWIRSSGWR